jgi:ribosome-binding protein aMBF1 (putative translation factor)
LVSAGTAPIESTTTALVFTVQFQPGAESNFSDITERAARNAKRPERQAALARARAWLAQSAFGDEPDSLKKLRLEKGLSQTQLASLMGTTQAQIARIESGQRDVQVSTIERLAEALDVDPVQVFNAVRVSKIPA